MNKHKKQNGKTYLKCKRVIDILFASLLLIILSPFLLFTGILIRIESRGPALFRQKRYGKNGKAFDLFKFRSMCVGAEKGGVYERKHDSRVTQIGRIIRKIAIDELPQLINILKGEMSIIGPRPVLTYHPWTIDKYTAEQMQRFKVRPGITGLAQVRGRKGIPWDRRLEYDVIYVNNVAWKLDLKIFLMTIVQVISMSNNVNTGKTAPGIKHAVASKSE